MHFIKIQILLIFSIPLIALGQIYDFHPAFEDSTGYIISAKTENYLSFEKINNEFQNKLFFGGNITNEEIDNISSKLKNKNVFGGYSNSEISFTDMNTNVFKLKRLGYKITVGEHLLGYGNLPKDLFNLAFKGNYGDTTFNFNETKFETLHYQSIGIGLVDKKYGSYVNLAFLHGTNFNSLNVVQSELNNYNGDSLQFSFAGAFKTSDTARNQFLSGNGYGMNLNFNLVLPIKIPKKDSSYLEWFISISADNVGFIQWNNQTVQYGQDTTYRFKGFPIEGTSIALPDSNVIDTLNIRNKKDKHFTWLPTQIWVRKLVNHYSNQKLQSFFGVGFWTIPQYTPMFYAGVYYRPAKWWAGSLNISYGGFGGIRGGFRSDFYINNKVHILLSTNDIVGMVSKKGYGRSLNFGVQWRF